MRDYERFPFAHSRSDQVGPCRMYFHIVSAVGAHFAFVGPYPGSTPGFGGACVSSLVTVLFCEESVAGQIIQSHFNTGWMPFW